HQDLAFPSLRNSAPSASLRYICLLPLHATCAVHIPKRPRIHLFTRLHPSPTLIFVGTMQILWRPAFFLRIFSLLLLFAFAMLVPAAQKPAEKRPELAATPDKEKNPAQIELLETRYRF